LALIQQQVALHAAIRGRQGQAGRQAQQGSAMPRAGRQAGGTAHLSNGKPIPAHTAAGHPARSSQGQTGKHSKVQRRPGLAAKASQTAAGRPVLQKAGRQAAVTTASLLLSRRKSDSKPSSALI
jgi:hypothetical protein